MNALRMADMIAATKLTREGKLREAMDVLKGGAPRPPPASDNMGAKGATIDATFKVVADAPVISLTPKTAKETQATAAPEPETTFSAARPSLLSGIQLGKGLFKQRPPKDLALPNGARFETRLFANDAGQRAYRLYVPSTYRHAAWPLVVMLHGCTQSAIDFAAGTGMSDLAEEQGFLVCYPEQSKSANSSRCWNWFSPSDQRRDQGEPSLIAGMSRQIVQEFGLDARRIYVAGLSAGGAAAVVMGAAYPDLYGAIGVHSGLACGAARDIPSALLAMRQGGQMVTNVGHGRFVPIIVFHGESDTTVVPLNGEQIVAQAAEHLGLQPSITEGISPGGVHYRRTVWSQEGRGTLLERWLLAGLGHAWSGGRSKGSFTAPRGPDASREMVRFFLQHSVPGPADV